MADATARPPVWERACEDLAAVIWGALAAAGTVALDGEPWTVTTHEDGVTVTLTRLSDGQEFRTSDMRIAMRPVQKHASLGPFRLLDYGALRRGVKTGGGPQAEATPDGIPAGRTGAVLKAEGETWLTPCRDPERTRDIAVIAVTNRAATLAHPEYGEIPVPPGSWLLREERHA